MPTWRRFGWAGDQLARDNALGAIVTRDGEVADWTLADFLATGRDDVVRFLTDLCLVVPSAPRTRALDCGCGVGRITRALANHFVRTRRSSTRASDAARPEAPRPVSQSTARRPSRLLAFDAAVRNFAFMR